MLLLVIMCIIIGFSLGLLISILSFNKEIKKLNQRVELLQFQKNTYLNVIEEYINGE